MEITTSLATNQANFEAIIKDCDDIMSRTMTLSSKDSTACIYYVEVAIDNVLLKESVIGNFIMTLTKLPPKSQQQFIENNAMGISDVKQLDTIEDAINGVMIGDAIIFVNGYNKAIKLKAKGYPNAGINSSQNENVYRGSKESFVDSIKSNTALIRKRVRSPKLKVKEFPSKHILNTNIALVYIEGVARPYVLNEATKRINKYLSSKPFIDPTDSGIIEQFISDEPLSLFPMHQITERPDKASVALLEGRVIIMVDNSPTALIVPTFFNHFFKTADDYYSNFYVASLSRLIRYIAFFLATSLPAIYVASLKYHPSLIPLELLKSMYKARETVPFSVTTEAILMELSFELLREAGIRIPGALGNTIGIVGGLIIGQASVSAGIASPIIVVVVALEALASFALPADELSNSLRILKYVQLILGSLFGFVGIFIGWYFTITMLCSLTNYGFPYLMNSVSRDIFKDPRDGFIRFPLSKMYFNKITKKR